MPRCARLDAPGALHHVMLRGNNRGDLFVDDLDRKNFLDRLGQVVEDGKCTVYAFALMSNHVHILLRSGDMGIATVMRKLLTWYALYFNRRHRRTGHLFENRYKSILCEEEPYFLELVRYIHLNPVRAGIVADMKGLDRYPWSGHHVIVGQGDLPVDGPGFHIAAVWQDEKKGTSGLSELHLGGLFYGTTTSTRGRRSCPQSRGMVKGSLSQAAWCTGERGRKNPGKQ